MRNDHKNVFALGDVLTLKAEGDIYAFARTAVDGSGKVGIVVLNRGKAAVTALPVSAPDGTVFKDQLSGKSFTVKAGILTLPLGDTQAMMLLD